jgi:hypothetical protein
MPNGKLLLTGFAMVLGLTLATAAYAADIVRPDEPGSAVTLRGDRLFVNLYTAGETVTIDQPVEKNVYAAGGTVVVDSAVGQSVHLAAGNLFVDGSVGGSAHLAGGTVVMRAPVADDLFVAGGQVTVAAAATVAGDLYAAGGKLVIDAPVLGDLYVGGGEVTLNAPVLGDVHANVERLTLGAEAAVAGDLDYRAAERAAWHASATVGGETVFRAQPADRTEAKRFGAGALAGFLAFAALAKLFAMLVLGLVLAYVLPRFSQAVVRESAAAFGPSLAVGLIVGVAVPLAAAFAFATLFGFCVAVAASAALIALWLLAGYLAPLLIGSFLRRALTRHDTYRLEWPDVLLGLAASVVLALVPLLGWLAALLVTAAVGGAVLRLAWRHR